MTEQEKLKREIESLKEGIRLAWLELAEKHMSNQDRNELHEHIRRLTEELAGQQKRLEQISFEQDTLGEQRVAE